MSVDPQREAMSRREPSAEPAPDEVVVGYATPLTIRPGETVDIRVSTAAEHFHAQLVRLVSAGPAGVVAEPLDADGATTYAGQQQSAQPGSSITVGPSPAFGALRSFTTSAWILQSLSTATPQVVMGTLDASGRAGWQLVVDAGRGLGLRVTRGDMPPFECFTEMPLAVGVWMHVVATVDADRGQVRLHQSELHGGSLAREVAANLEGHAGGDLLVVAAPQAPHHDMGAVGNGCFNGKISAPVVFDGALAAARAQQVREGEFENAGAPAVCVLDLADALTSARFADRSMHRHEAIVRNGPTTGVTGPLWRARISSFLQDSAQYAAIHFHDDDLDDCDWEAAFSFASDSDLPSGVYAARLSTADSTDFVPFFVSASGSGPRSDIAVLVPTLTYLAYANEHEILSNPRSYTAFTGLDASEARLTWRDQYSVDRGYVSLYDVHRDGSSVCYASTRRPLLNVRPDYSWPLINGPHGLAVDLGLMGWLAESGFGFDVLTDHDLHEHGPEALRPYRVLISGGHPEYWTSDMLDSLESYLGGGGRMMYLGGNGLCWVTGIDTERPHVMEVRRGISGTRPSTSGAGEAWLSTTREEGGMWRNRGRSSHLFVGVGTTAMGAGPGRPYSRAEASYLPEYAFVFDGIAGAQFGAHGTILGGAAAYEFDRADANLGTPAYASILATATGFRSLYFPFMEDFTGSCLEMADPGSALVRADMVMMIRENGGGVFSAGSAAWCGSLVDPSGYPTDVATITANVVRRFAATPHGANPLGPRGS
jgi:N,N-dimethylformamidase